MNSHSKYKYRLLLVGHLYPPELESKISKQPLSPIQTQTFGLALLDALRRGFGCDEIDVLSVAPLLDYPHSQVLLAPGAKWVIDKKIFARMVPFVNIIGIKHFTRFIGTLVSVIQWVFRNRNCHRVIMLYGVQSCKIWGVLLGQILAPCTIVPVLTDDIGISLDWENKIIKNMRRIDVNLMKVGLKRVNGIIALTPKLAQKLAPGRPVLIVPAIHNSRSELLTTMNGIHDDGSFSIVYTGRLSHKFGINLLLETFIRADRPNWRLMLTGWGELESTVQEFTQTNPRAHFLGVLSSEKIRQLYRLADVLVNPKLTSTSIAEFAFPSKIVEYLTTGKPIVSTNLPVFDDRFRQHLVIAQSDSPEELLRCFDEVAAWDDHQRENCRFQNIRFVEEELSPAVQGARIHTFIDSLRSE